MSTEWAFDFPSIDCSGCGVPTSCCPDSTIPIGLHGTISGPGCPCIGTALTFTWDAAGANGPGWYTPIMDCGGVPLYFFFYCSDGGDTFSITEYCDNIGFNFVGAFPTSCNPLLWSSDTTGSIVCCNGGARITITE